MAEKNQTNDLLNINRPFAQRIIEGWEIFSKGEEKLRRMIDTKENSENITAYCCELLNVTFSDISFEVGFNGEKYDLILSPEKEKLMLYFIEAFKKCAPQEVLKNWNIILGRSPSKNCKLGFHGKSVSPDEISVKVRKDEELNLCDIVGYCESLNEVLNTDKNEALWFFDLLLDMTVGEIVNMRYIETVDMTDKPFEAKDNAIHLNELPKLMKEMFGENDGWDTAESYLDVYTGYSMEPNENPENFAPRNDVYVGFSALPPILNCFYGNDDYFVEKAEGDGATIGYIFYPIDEINEEEGKKRSDAILDFRDELEQYITEKTGGTAGRFIGGATGIYCSYLDFIAWDLKKVLDTAQEFFRNKNLVEWADFSIFSLVSKSVMIFER